MLSKYPTDPLTILKLQNPLHDVPELHKILRTTDVEAPKVRKGRSGIQVYQLFEETLGKLRIRNVSFMVEDCSTAADIEGLGHKISECCFF